MPVVIPNTFVPGTPIEADKVHENLTAVRKWVNGGMVSGDLATAPAWLDRQHIVRPRYDGITNTFYFVSSILGGQQYGTTPTFAIPRQTYVDMATTDPNAVYAVENYKTVPGTGLSFHTDQLSNVLYQVVAYPQTHGLSDSTAMVADIIIDRNLVLPQRDNGVRLYSLGDSPTVFPNAFRIIRHPWSCTGLWSVNAGDHTVELIARSSSPKTVIVTWSISLEVRWA